jgi:hypothetical protein
MCPQNERKRNVVELYYGPVKYLFKVSQFLRFKMKTGGSLKKYLMCSSTKHKMRVILICFKKVPHRSLGNISKVRGGGAKSSNGKREILRIVIILFVG